MVLGITGGPGCGKSTVTRLLRDRGAVTFSADEAARAVLSADSPVLAHIRAIFGTRVLHPDGTLNRAEMARIVFADPGAREALNSVTHPAILRLLYSQIESARRELSRSKIVAVEVPLLFEAGLADWFERILVVAASEPTQIARLMARSGLTEAQARALLDAQWPLSVKVGRADDVIRNDGPLAELTDDVDRLWDSLVSRCRSGEATR